MADLTPPSKGDFTDSCSIHISFLLWELNIWQYQVLADLPPIKWQFHRFLLYSESSYLADPLSNGDFTDSCEIHISFLLWELNISDQVLADLNAHQMAISQIPALTAHISWQLIFHSYSESSTFGRPGLGRSTPIWVAISLILTLTTLISFLLWELIIWQTRSWHIYPPIQWWFHRFLFWQLTTLRAQHLADQVLGRCNPPHQMANSQIPALLWKLIYGRLRVGRSTPPPSYGNFTDCCSDSSYFIPTLTTPHLADQVLADLPPSSMAISQIPTLPWELIFGRPSVGRSTPTSNGNSTDSCEILISFLF